MLLHRIGNTLNRFSFGFRISQPGFPQAMRPQDQLRWQEGLRIAGVPE